MDVELNAGSPVVDDRHDDPKLFVCKSVLLCCDALLVVVAGRTHCRIEEQEVSTGWRDGEVSLGIVVEMNWVCVISIIE